MSSRLNWRKILFIETYPAACLVRSLLEEAGFHPAPVPDAESVFLAGADLVYYIEVLTEEVAAAGEFLAARGYADKLLPSTTRPD